MTAILAPSIVFKDFDGNGLPLAFGTVATYQAGTLTPQASYTDSSQSTPNPNPLTLNNRGEAQIWLDPLLVYKFIVKDVFGNQVRVVDNVAGSLTYTQLVAILTQQFIGQILYPRTAAEIAAGVTPTNYAVQPGYIPRWGPVNTISTTNWRNLHAITGRVLCIQDVDPTAGTGSASVDTAAIIAAATQLGQLGYIYLPQTSAGYFINPNAITFAGPVCLLGDGGALGATMLTANGFSSGQFMFTWDASGPFINRAAMTGFYCKSTNSFGSVGKLTKCAQMKVTDVFCESMQDGFDLTNSYSPTFERFRTRNHARYGIVLRDSSNDVLISRGAFDGVAGGAYGVYLVGGNSTASVSIRIIGNDFEGFTAAGSHPIVLSPAAGSFAAGVSIHDNYFENVHDELILSTPIDANGVRVLSIEDNRLSGSATSTDSIVLNQTQGISIRRNYAITETTSLVNSQGSNTAIHVEENELGTGIAPYRFTAGSDTGLYVNNNRDTSTNLVVSFSGSDNVRGQAFTAALDQTEITITYSASMNTNAAQGNLFVITMTNGTAFTINAPTNPAQGQVITYTLRNTSGGAAGAATWNAAFKMSAWTNPANGQNRSITFKYNGTNWIQVSQTGVDVPN